MKRSKFTESQIAFILRQAEEGTAVGEVCRKAGIRIVMITVSHGGAALVLLTVSRTIPAFFAWQIVVASIWVTWLAIAVWGVFQLARHHPQAQA